VSDKSNLQNYLVIYIALLYCSFLSNYVYKTTMHGSWISFTDSIWRFWFTFHYFNVRFLFAIFTVIITKRCNWWFIASLRALLGIHFGAEITSPARNSTFAFLMLRFLAFELAKYKKRNFVRNNQSSVKANTKFALGWRY